MGERLMKTRTTASVALFALFSVLGALQIQIGNWDHSLSGLDVHVCGLLERSQATVHRWVDQEGRPVVSIDFVDWAARTKDASGARIADTLKARWISDSDLLDLSTCYPGLKHLGLTGHKV